MAAARKQQKKTQALRPLSAKDRLYTLDAQTGARQYVPLTMDGATWAGRSWCHCGDMDGVLLVAWDQRNDVWAPLRWRVIAQHEHGMVCSTGAVLLTEPASAA